MTNKLIFGVGLNDADEPVTRYVVIAGKRKRAWICPFYARWMSMLKRCYSTGYHNLYPTYKGCSVCEEWLTFSNFKRWMETQDWEGRYLDKDVLFLRNKVYSPETCVFVSNKVNTFMFEFRISDTDYLTGVDWYKRDGKFRARCAGLNGKSKHLGLFNTELEAHLAWLKYKQEVALKLASEQTDPRVAKALIERYENYAAQEKEIA